MVEGLARALILEIIVGDVERGFESVGKFHTQRGFIELILLGVGHVEAIDGRASRGVDA